jgi:hypothetical protein
MEEVEADFPEQDEPTPAYKAAFTHEPAAYTLSSQLTLQSQASTEAVRTPQVRGGGENSLQHLRTFRGTSRTRSNVSW